MQKYRAEVDIQPEGQYFCNQPPYHTLYVISYGDSEAKRVCEDSIREPGQVAGDAICIPYSTSNSRKLLLGTRLLKA